MCSTLDQVRARINPLLLDLWDHPLGDSQRSMLAFANDAADTTNSSSSPHEGKRERGATGDGGGGSGSEGFGEDGFHAFVIAAYDTITYNFHDAMERIRDGCRVEQKRGGNAPKQGDEKYEFYMHQQVSCNATF